jgi:YD repeat-containing protein
VGGRQGGSSAHGGSYTSSPKLDCITYAYDADGRKISQTDANANTTSDAYNALGELTSVTDPLGHVTSYTYDANGNKTSQTDADGNVTTYSYNADNELVSETLGSGTSAAITQTYGTPRHRASRWSRRLGCEPALAAATTMVHR